MNATREHRPTHVRTGASVRIPAFPRPRIYRFLPRASLAQASHLLQDILGLLGDPAGIMRRVHTDGLEKLVLIVTVEGGLANEHLVEQDSEGPPVHGEGVLQALQDLGRRRRGS